MFKQMLAEKESKWEQYKKEGAERMQVSSHQSISNVVMMYVFQQFMKSHYLIQNYQMTKKDIAPKIMCTE